MGATYLNVPQANLPTYLTPANDLSDLTLTSLTGVIIGKSSSEEMALRSYNPDNSFGTIG